MVTYRAINNKRLDGSEYLHGLGELAYSPVVDGKELSMIAETPDIAMLIGIGYKYQGGNTQFATFACRMLQIESEWSK